MGLEIWDCDGGATGNDDANFFDPRLAGIRTLPAVAAALVGGKLFAQEGELRDIPPKGITVPELIQRFATKEKEFKAAREQYTWTQSVKVQTLEGGTVDGEYQQVFDVLLTTAAGELNR